MPPYPPNHVLRYERIKRGWSQRKLAEMLGASPDTVRYWEAGWRDEPSPYYRAKLCEIFGLPPERLGLRPISEAEHAAEARSSPFPDAQALPDAALLAPVFGMNLHQMKQVLLSQGVDENRRTMLLTMRNAVKQELSRSLRHATLIALGLIQVPEALAHPWRFALQHMQERACALPEGTTIVDVYEHAEGALLILGEPGVGKSTLLLELTRVLLTQAEQQVACPIPVIFDLSSWIATQTSLTEWMLEHLQKEYQVRRSIAQEWIDTNQLVLLLDGLDDAPEGARPACVQAINGYHQQHPSVPLVVCCRAKEYFAQATRVDLQQAVVIQPLTETQIDAYLSHADGRLDVVRKALQDDPAFQELVRLPVILHFTVHAYLGDNAVPTLIGSQEERRQQIVQQYVQRMLERRSASPYHASQAMRWLTFLASQMKKQSQSVFYLERMQPDWLPDEHASRQYRLTIIRLLFSLICFAGAGIFALSRGDSFPTQPGLFFWIGGGRGSSILGWMAQGLGGGLKGAASFGIILVAVSVLSTILGRRGGIPTLTRGALCCKGW